MVKDVALVRLVSILIVVKVLAAEYFTATSPPLLRHKEQDEHSNVAVEGGQLELNPGLAQRNLDHGIVTMSEM